MPDSVNHCTSCGIKIPDNGKSSCSMCYGDLNYGGCSAYRDFMESDHFEQEREQVDEQEDL